MKTWMKGAIVGAVWGSLAIPIYLIFAYLWGWERQVPKLIEQILQVLVYLPLILAKPLTVNFPTSMILGLTINFFGWIIIGALLGYAWNKLRGC